MLCTGELVGAFVDSWLKLYLALIDAKQVGQVPRGGTQECIASPMEGEQQPGEWGGGSEWQQLGEWEGPAASQLFYKVSQKTG